MAVLDVFFSGDARAISLGSRIMELAGNHQRNPMDQMSDETLLMWCKQDPATRFAALASATSVFGVSTNGIPTSWTSRGSLLVHRAPDPIAVMGTIVARLRPTIWSGSRATIMESNANLLRQFDARGNDELAAFIDTEIVRLLREAAAQREWETTHDRARDEMFE
jgi:hypothetical protein